MKNERIIHTEPCSSADNSILQTSIEAQNTLNTQPNMEAKFNLSTTGCDVHLGTWALIDNHNFQSDFSGVEEASRQIGGLAVVKNFCFSYDSDSNVDCDTSHLYIITMVHLICT